MPPVPPLPVETVTRRLALIEEMSRFLNHTPAEAELGTIEWDSGAGVGAWRALRMEGPVTKTRRLGRPRPGNGLT